MSAKKGLGMSSEEGADSIWAELEQLVKCKVTNGKDKKKSAEHKNEQR